MDNYKWIDKHKIAIAVNNYLQATQQGLLYAWLSIPYEQRRNVSAFSLVEDTIIERQRYFVVEVIWKSALP